ncbi:MAG TPA: LysR family transcriptional regulator [bacterium]|jgi:LysR family hydrogen peroxide-inducible transcriptional activator|nr:LysR family transcriptional regulator [bacterium]
METHQLRYFLAVTQTGRFTAAAKQCNVSQPSLSIQIAKLEEELGGELFERGKKGIKLTSRGEMFLPRAKAILGEMESAQVDALALSGLSMGKVSLGCMPTTGAHLLPPILTSFRKAYPKIQVQLKEESSPELAKDLSQGEVELAILDEAGLQPGLDHQTILTEELLLVLPAKHPLAGKKSLSLKQVAEEPFILMKSGHGFRQITLDFYRKAGLEPKVVFESGGIETVQALVAAGLGISLVPQMVAKFPGVSYASVSQLHAARTLSLAWRKKAPLSHAAEALKKVILSTVKR